jgi:hypothetical protein
VGAGTGLLAGSAVGAGNASISAEGLQQRYDIAYAQCMAASGDHVQALPVAWSYAPYEYGYGYPGYYSPWFDQLSPWAFSAGLAHIISIATMASFMVASIEVSWPSKRRRGSGMRR